MKALGDTPVCPTCNQTLPSTSLEWGDAPTPPPSDNDTWGAQIDTKQKKRKPPKKNNDFRCYRCGKKNSHLAKHCKTDFAEIQQKGIEKKRTRDSDVTE